MNGQWFYALIQDNHKKLFERIAVDQRLLVEQPAEPLAVAVQLQSAERASAKSVRAATGQVDIMVEDCTLVLCL